MQNEDARGTRLTLAAVAAMIHGRLEGRGDLEIRGVAPVDEAGPDQLAFLASPRYVPYAAESGGAAFLVSEELEDEVPADSSRVAVADAYSAMRTLLQHFHPPRPHSAGVHSSVVLGRGVRLGSAVAIGPYAVVDDEVTLGDGSVIGAHCVIGRGSVVGANSRLHPHVVLYDDTILGERVLIHSGARLGPDGFGYTVVDGEHAKIPQVGRCVVEDDVEIGANTTIDRGSLGDTRVGRGVKLDNLVHIAHNVRVGARTLMAALVGIAGSTRIGEDVFFGGQSGAVNQLRIGDGAKVAVQAGVISDLEAGGTYSGYPARSHRDAMRGYAHVARLPKLIDRIRALEEEVERLSRG